MSEARWLNNLVAKRSRPWRILIWWKITPYVFYQIIKGISIQLNVVLPITHTKLHFEYIQSKCQTFLVTNIHGNKYMWIYFLICRYKIGLLSWMLILEQCEWCWREDNGLVSKLVSWSDVWTCVTHQRPSMTWSWKKWKSITRCFIRE